MTWVSQDVQAANEVGRKERLTTLSESYAVDVRKVPREDLVR